MKLIPLLLFLLTALPLTAQMEFERVWQVFPDGGIARGTELYFKNDTILLETQSTHSGSDEINYFFSTDEGRNWKDLRENFILGTPVKEKYDYLGTLHPLTFEFVKMDRVNDTTTNIYYMNLQGEIHKKVSFPYRADQSGIKLNPIDPDFISLHRQIERFFPFQYNHDVGYSIDRGETWDFMRPEEELKKQRDINLANFRKIDYKFSSIKKGKILYSFIWSNNSTFFYWLTSEFNYFDKEYTFAIKNYGFEKLLCYECFGEDKLTYINYEEDEFDSFDLNTGEESTMVFKNRLPFLNIDSLEIESKLVEISGFWGDDFAFLKSNQKNNYHKILCVSIRSENITGSSFQISYINQIFFQTFDKGITWEYLFNNNNLYHQVVGMFINHENNDLWILKDSTVNNRIGPQSWYPVLYKSKSPLTYIENNINNNSLQLHFNNNYLTIYSDVDIINSNIKIYNLSGQLLYSNGLEINKGSNDIRFNREINDRLILIQISTNKKNSIFKLIRSDK